MTKEEKKYFILSFIMCLVCIAAALLTSGLVVFTLYTVIEYGTTETLIPYGLMTLVTIVLWLMALEIGNDLVGDIVAAAEQDCREIKNRKEKD